MMHVITCENCGSHSINIEFSFDYSDIQCKECHHSRYEKWKYWFCGLKCFFTWAQKNEVEEKGLPCRSCLGNNGEPTGWAHGFESNGVCDICDGSKRVKNKLFFNTKYERIENPNPEHPLDKR